MLSSNACKVKKAFLNCIFIQISAHCVTPMVLNDREKLKPGGLSLGSSEWITSSGFEKAGSGFDYKKTRVGFSKNVKNMCFSKLFLLKNNYIIIMHISYYAQ